MSEISDISALFRQKVGKSQLRQGTFERADTFAQKVPRSEISSTPPRRPKSGPKSDTFFRVSLSIPVFAEVLADQDFSEKEGAGAHGF